MRGARPSLAAALLLALPFAARAKERPAEWAQPVPLAGAPNLHRVTPELYRGAQPTAAGLRGLKALGVKTVINLRALHSDESLLRGSGLLENRLNVKTWHIEDEDVVRVLKDLRRKENGPFLIHCMHGADRTGVMSAMFRMVEQGWSKAAALREMREGGYGFHPVWRNVVRYVERVDVAAIRRRVDAEADRDAKKL